MVLGTRQTTDGENPLDCGSGIVRGADLRGAHMKFAQPNGWIGGIERHEAIVQEEDGKAKQADRNVIQSNTLIWADGQFRCIFGLKDDNSMNRKGDEQ